MSVAVHCLIPVLFTVLIPADVGFGTQQDGHLPTAVLLLLNLRLDARELDRTVTCPLPCRVLLSVPRNYEGLDHLQGTGG